MRLQKGVTMISLVIYVMSFLAVTGIVVMITNFVYNNNKVLSSQATASSEWDMLNLYLTKEAKEPQNFVTVNSETEITFSNGNKYIFKEENGQIIFSSNDKYFVLCNYIEEITVSKEDDTSNSPFDTFKVEVKILGKKYTQTYTIN